MRDGHWPQQVLSNLAGAMLQAARWRAWESAGGEPGPDDNESSWPCLPENPGEKVQLGITKLDMSTPEGWATAKALLQDSDWTTSSWPEMVQSVAEQLAEHLEHSPLLGPAFYDKHSRRAGDMLSTEQRTLPVTVLTGSYQSLWKTPKSPLGLPPADHFMSPSAENSETVALNQVAWEAARDLYRSLGGSQPDEQGRRGLEQPKALQLWCERLGLVEPDGTMAVGPLSDEEVTRIATGLPWSKAQATMLSPRVEDRGSDKAPGHLHSSRQAMNPSRGGYEALVSVADHSSAESVDPLAWAHVQKAQELLETHGPEMARLSLYLSMHVCGRPDPTAPFLVDGEDMLKDFALDSTSGGRGRVAVLEKSKRLRHQATLARALDLVTVQTKDYLGPADKNGSRPFRRFTGRLWSVESLEMGTETQLTLNGQTAAIPADEVVTSLRLLIRPGSWVALYPTQSQSKGQQLWYGHVATSVLRLSHERNQLAATLGLFLSTALYERQARQTGEVRFRVCDLLSKVLVASDLEKALEKTPAGRDRAFKLRQSWVAALDLLHHKVGFRFSFCPDTYPAFAVPEVLRQTSEDISGRAPHGALEQLLKGYITVRWPEPVLTLAGSSKAEEQSRALLSTTAKPAQRKRPTRGTPNGTLLKEGRKTARLNQKAAASVLGISPAQMCKLEGNQKTLSRNTLDLYLAKLAEAGRKQRWGK